MPQFTQWNVPDPFPNILYNPAAVDAAIARTQSELGNLDIERQKFGLEKAKFDRGVTEGEGYIGGSLSGTTGTTGAGVGGTYAPGTPFTPKMLPPGVSLDEDAMVRTIAGEAGNEPLAGQIETDATSSTIERRGQVYRRAMWCSRPTSSSHGTAAPRGHGSRRCSRPTRRINRS